jgi:hypothetical protein
VRWCVILSEEHISGKENEVVDGLTRVHRAQLQHIPAHHQHLYVDDTIQHIFRLEGTGTEVVDEGYIESEDEDIEVLDTLGPIERHNIFSKFHNAMVTSELSAH